MIIFKYDSTGNYRTDGEYSTIELPAG